jgi:hypothetical protein
MPRTRCDVSCFLAAVFPIWCLISFLLQYLRDFVLYLFLLYVLSPRYFLHEPIPLLILRSVLHRPIPVSLSSIFASHFPQLVFMNMHATNVCAGCALAMALCGCLITGSQNGWTALFSAAVFGRTDCLRLLIEAGADKDAKNNVRVGRCFDLASSRLISPFFSSSSIVHHPSLSASFFLTH